MSINNIISNIALTGENVDLLKEYLANKKINQCQFDAAIKYLKIQHEFEISISSPSEFLEKVKFNITDFKLLDYVKWCLFAKTEFTKAFFTLQKLQNTNLYNAFLYCVIFGKDYPNYSAHISEALNLFVKYFNENERLAR